MKKQLSALSLVLLSFTARQASPENRKTEECRIVLPGITFTRSLNQAAAHAKVEGGRITLASQARRPGRASRTSDWGSDLVRSHPRPGTDRRRRVARG